MRNMRILLWALGLIFWSSGTVIAQSPTAEDFNYTAGEALADQAGGDNWNGPWAFVAPATVTGDIGAITSGGITAAASGLTSSGNSFEVDHRAGDSNKRYYRGLPTAITDDGNSYWLSFFMDASWSPGSGSVTYVMLMDTATIGPGGPGGQLLQFGRRFSAPFLSIARGGTVDDSSVPADQGNFVVIRIDMSGDAENETIWMWANPDPNMEPDTSTADKKSTIYALNDGFNGLGIKVEGGGDLFTRIDEVRFGPNFADVIADDLTFSKILTTEKFNVPAGTLVTEIDQPGNGWGSGWISRIGPDAEITANGIENFNIFRQTSGNKLVVAYETTPETRLMRALNTPYEDDGNTYYLSFSTRSDFSTINNGAFLMLVDTASYQSGGPGGQLVSIGKVPNQNLIGLGVNFNLDATTTASADEGAFIVAKISFSGNADEDTISIYVNPDPDTGIEPATPDATRLFTNLNNGFDGIGIKVGGAQAGITAEFDDILLGESYAEVIPQDFIPLFNPISAFAYDQFSYPPGEELTGQGTAENGWAEPWQTITPADSSVILPTGLLNNALSVRSTAESVEMYSLPGGNRIQRLFDTPIDTIANDTFWMAALLRITGSIGGNVGTVNLVDTSLGGPQFQQVFFGKRFGSTNIFAGGFGSGGDMASGADFDLSTASWVVIRMDRSDSSTWSLDLWVDPDPMTTPQEGDALIQNKVYNSGNFHGVMLKSEGAPGVNFSVDDLLLGDTFSDVVPPDLEPIPPVPTGAIDNYNDYAADSDLAGQSEGTGWAEPYQLISGTSPIVRESPMTNFFLLKETSGNSLESSGPFRMDRALDGTYGDVGRTFWLGWFFEAKNGGSDVAHLVLADTATYGPTGGGGQLVQIGKGFGGNSLVIAGAGQAGANTDTVHFLVAEIVTNGTADPDQVYLWVDPDLSNTPSRDTANVVANASLSTWNAIGFKVDEDPPGSASVVARWDDIRLGGSFSEIIPPDLSDVAPPEIPQVAEETFDYPVGEDLDGQDGGIGWGGPWDSVEGTVTIGDGSIPSDRVNLAGNKANLSQTGTAVTYDRPFFAPFGADASTVWTSFLINIDNKDIGNLANLSLVNEGAAVLSVGGIQGLGDLSVVYNGSQTATEFGQGIDENLWVVARIEMNGTDEDDRVLLWVNPVADALPTDESAVFDITDIDLDAGFDALRITANGVGSASLMADEFRIGFSFRDVSNKFGSSDPNLIAYEPFNYDEGLELIGAGGINAFWNGVWFNAGNLAGNETEITEGSVAFPEFEVVGNKVEFRYLEEATQIRIDRELAFPLESDGSVYWLTWFQNTTTGDQLNNVSNLSLRNSGIPANDGQRLNIGRMFGAGKFGMISPPANLNQQTEVDDIGLNWVVVRIQTVDDPAVPDTAWMWINPASDVEPDTADAEFFNPNRNYYAMGFLKDGIDIIRLKVEGINGMEVPHVVDFDELRIARNWESATGVTGVVEPLPEDPFQLLAFPNPARNQLTVQFELDQSEQVRLSLFDLNGRLVRDLFNGRGSSGENQIQMQLDAGIQNGIYFLMLQSRREHTARKLIIFR